MTPETQSEARMSESAAVTQWHVEAIEAFIDGNAITHDKAALRDVLANIRSQVSGESVNVPRSELEEVREITRSAFPNPASNRIWELVSSWLTPAPKGETK